LYYLSLLQLVATRLDLLSGKGCCGPAVLTATIANVRYSVSLVVVLLYTLVVMLVVALVAVAFAILVELVVLLVFLLVVIVLVASMGMRIAMIDNRYSVGMGRMLLVVTSVHAHRNQEHHHEHRTLHKIHRFHNLCF